MLRLSNPTHHATTLSFCASSRRRARRHVSVSAVATQAPTLYDILAISPTAGREEIKAAFKKAALRWHPDTCQSPSEKQLFTEQFKQVREAYDVLSDPLRRRCYNISIGIGGGFEAKNWRDGYRVWEIQLEGLSRRGVRSENSWAARVRRAHQQNQSGPLDKNRS